MSDCIELNKGYQPYRKRKRNGEIDLFESVISPKYTVQDLLCDIRNGEFYYSYLTLFLSSHHLCYNPGCTTCGGEGARRILSQLTKEEVIRFVNESGVNYLGWHDIMTQVLRVYPAEWFESTEALRIYRMANEMFDKLVHKYCWRPRNAWVEVHKMIESGGADCWMELESAKQ